MLVFLVSFVLAGLALQLAARFWPVRAFERAPEYAIDLLALVVALVCQVTIATLAFPWIHRAQEFHLVSAGHHYLSSLPALPAAAFYFLTVDFLAYWMHRLNHAAWLWSTHAFHHSPRNLYWASGMRGSPVHFLLLGAPGLAVQLLFAPQGIVLLLVTAYGIVHNSFIHSNVKVPTRLLNWVFITGESHFVHHGRDLRLGNSNFGFLFTFWDRLFGTWIDPRTLPANYPLGLPYEVGYARLVTGLPAPRSSGPVPVDPPVAEVGRVRSRSRRQQRKTA